MKMLSSLLLSFSLLVTSALLAHHQEASVKQGCACENCSCTEESHCGCYSSAGCNCSENCGCGSAQCNSGKLLSVNKNPTLHHGNEEEHKNEDSKKKG